MAIVCQQNVKSNRNEREFCRAFLNNENPIWIDNDMIKVRKRGFRLPPDDFVYGLKHPKQNGITGVAAALQQDFTPIDIPKSVPAPDFITLNKTAARLGLTKVRDIHQYRKMNNNQPTKTNCSSIEKNSMPDITFGRVTAEQPSIRDLLEHKYLHEWLYNATIRHCKELLNNKSSKITKKFSLKNKINK